MDISNGEGIGISLFVQGCKFHCKNCFNSSTWDFSGGKEWTKQKEDEFLKLADKPSIKRISILGGEPLAPENIRDVTFLLERCKYLFPNKKTWLWSGYDFKTYIFTLDTLKYLDYVIDGKYIDELKNYKLIFRGSSNQNIWCRRGGEWTIYAEDNFKK